MSTRWAGSNRRQRLPADWRQRRAIVLRRDPICRHCGRAPSVEVDHIRAGQDNHDLDQLQGLCGPCHATKSGREGAAAAHRHTKTRAPEPHPGARR